MKKLILLLGICFLLVTPSLKALDHLQFITADSKDRKSTHTHSYTAQNEGELKEAITLTEREIETFRKKYPRAPVHILSLSSSNFKGSGKSVDLLAKELAPKNSKLFKETIHTPETLSDKSKSNYVFTVVRGIMIGGVVTLTLVITKDIAPLIAAPIGILSGAMSGFLQLYNQKYLTWLRSQGWFKLTAETTSMIRTYAKESMVLLIYMGAIHGGMVSLGIKPDLISTEVMLNMVKGVGLSLYSETFWNVINADLTKKAITKNPESIKKYRLISNGSALTLSVLITAVQVMDLAGVPLGTVLYGIIGAGAMGVYSWKCMDTKAFMESVRTKVSAFLSHPCRVLRRSGKDNHVN